MLIQVHSLNKKLTIALGVAFIAKHWPNNLKNQNHPDEFLEYLGKNLLLTIQNQPLLDLPKGLEVYLPFIEVKKCEGKFIFPEDMDEKSQASIKFAVDKIDALDVLSMHLPSTTSAQLDIANEKNKMKTDYGIVLGNDIRDHDFVYNQIFEVYNVPSPIFDPLTFTPTLAFIFLYKDNERAVTWFFDFARLFSIAMDYLEQTNNNNTDSIFNSNREALADYVVFAARVCQVFRRFQSCLQRNEVDPIDNRIQIESMNFWFERHKKEIKEIALRLDKIENDIDLQLESTMKPDVIDELPLLRERLLSLQKTTSEIIFKSCDENLLRRTKKIIDVGLTGILQPDPLTLILKIKILEEAYKKYPATPRDGFVRS